MGGGEPHHANEACQRLTWAKSLGPTDSIFWLKGSSSDQFSSRRVVTKDEGSSLICSVREGQQSLLPKTLLASQWCLDNLEFDFLVRSNTSSYFFEPLLLDHVAGMSPNTIEGPFGNWSGSIDPRFSHTPYIEGYSLILPRSAVAALSEISLNQWEGIPDDVAITQYLRLKGFRAREARTCSLTYGDALAPSFHTRLKDPYLETAAAGRFDLVHAVYCSQSRAEIVERLGNVDSFNIRVALRTRPHRIDKVLTMKARQDATFQGRVSLFQRALDL